MIFPERVLGIHLNGLTLTFYDRQFAQLVEPVITSRVHRNLGLGVAHHDDALDRWGKFHCIVDDLLHREDCAVNPRSVSSDNNLRLRAVNTRVKSFRGVAREHYRVHRTDLGASQHREENLRNAGR